MLLEQITHLRSYLPKVHCPPAAHFHKNFNILFPFVGDEMGSEVLGVRIHRGAELCEDFDPDIVRENNEKLVVAARQEESFSKSVG